MSDEIIVSKEIKLTGKRPKLDGRVRVTRKRQTGQSTEHAVIGRRRRAEKLKAGRPTDYRDCYCDQIREYFGSATPWEINYTDKGGAQVIPKDRMPTIPRFCHAVGIHVSTFYKWVHKHEEFAEAVAEALEMQKAFLMESGGVSIQAGFATFVLKAAHNMRDDTPLEDDTDDDQGDVEVDPKGKGQGE